MGRSKKNTLLRAKTLHALNTSHEDFLDRLIAFVLAFCAAVVPLLLRIHQMKLDAVTSRAYKGVATYFDVFNYLKAQFLMIALGLMCLYWVIRFLQRRFPLYNPMLVPLGIYLLFVVLSAVLSPFRWVAFNGYPDRLEGFFVLLAYVMLAMTGALTVRTDKVRTVIIVAVMLSSVILAVLGASQYLDRDFFQTVAGRNLFIPTAYAALFDKLDFNFGKNVMYVTVYNPNYLGSYSALLLPVAIMLTYHWLENKKWYVALGFLFVAANFMLWLGGMSRAGLLGGGVALLFLLVVGIRSVLRHWKATLLMVVLCGAVFSGMNHFSNGLVKSEFIRTLPSAIQEKLATPKASMLNPFVLKVYAESAGKDETVESVADNQQEPSSAVEAPVTATAEESALAALSEPPPQPTPTPTPKPVKKPLVTQVTLNDNRFHFETETETVVVVLEEDEFILLDENEHTLLYTIKENVDKNGVAITTAYFDDARYAGYSMQLISGGALFRWYKKTIPLIVTEGKLTIMTKENVYESHIEAPAVWGFEGKEGFASSRGYIWSRSIPLMRETMFVGAGPDAFAMMFPQTDIAGKINWFGDINILVDKPHNWYLQMAINTGGISLIAMLVFLAWYLLIGIKIKNEPVIAGGRLIHIGIMSGVVGYLVAAVFNDSNVSVSPVFWVILGLGLSYLIAVDTTKQVNASTPGKAGSAKSK